MNNKISPAKGLQGKINVSSDKSISHRALLIGAISEGITEIIGLSNGFDVQSTANCLKQLGVSINIRKNRTIVHGVGLNGFSAPPRSLDAGNSGTTMRLLSGLLAGQNFSSILTGDNSLQKRPMNRIIEPLRQMGAQINCSNDGSAPLIINGSGLNPIHYQSPVASAQVKSCVLLAGLYAEGTTSITEPYLSRDHTERMLQDFGIEIRQSDLTVSVHGKAQPLAAKIEVPGDISSAAFFLVAGTIVPNAELTIERVGINPTRTGIIDVLKAMGANMTIRPIKTSQNEPLADLTISTSNLSGVKIAAPQVPALIDELPIIAIAAVRAEGRTEVSGARELRVKESDRLNSILINLRAMGIEIQEKEDGFIIEGPQDFYGTEIETFSDHRIAMAFTIAGLIAHGDTIIKNSEYASISMPDFYQIIEQIMI